jgi:hypothetical protein
MRVRSTLRKSVTTRALPSRRGVICIVTVVFKVMIYRGLTFTNPRKSRVGENSPWQTKYQPFKGVPPRGNQ